MNDGPVRAARVELVGARQFWLVRSADLPALGGLAALHAELGADFRPEADAPLGIAVLVGPGEDPPHPEGEWSDPHAVYAGRLEDGTRVWLAYFADAVIRKRRFPAVPLDRWDDGAEVVPFDEQDAFTGQDVIDLWLREGALSASEAARRVDEVILLAIDDGTLVGVSTAFLADSAQLGTRMWFGRTFVAESERRKATAGRLTWGFRELLGGRFADGRETRAPGIVLEIENQMLQQVFCEAVWVGSEFTYIGTNARGDDVRVLWFPGALAP